MEESQNIPKGRVSPDQMDQKYQSIFNGSDFLCGVCSLRTTDACYTCGPANYWQNFEPRLEALENPPEFPSIRKWHRMGYGEKINVLGFYMRALLENGKDRERY